MYQSYNNMFYKVVSTHDVTNFLLFTVYRIFLFYLTIFKISFLT